MFKDHIESHAIAFGYRCQPYNPASMVYFTFPFDIYNEEKHYTN